MDPSTPSVQDVQSQQPSDDQSVSPTQPVSQDQSSKPAPQPKTSTMISVGAEAGPAMIVQENPDADEDDEDELVAPQETKNLGVMGQGEEQSDEQQIVTSQPSVVDINEESVELQPAVPEIATSSPEVEKIIERSVDREKPDLPKIVQDAGVTHDGPGIIAVEKNNFSVTKMPETYDEAVVEEKQSQLHDSKHWLSAMIMYIWRKLNPELGKTKKIEKKIKTIQPNNVPDTSLPESIGGKD